MRKKNVRFALVYPLLALALLSGCTKGGVPSTPKTESDAAPPTSIAGTSSTNAPSTGTPSTGAPSAEQATSAQPPQQEQPFDPAHYLEEAKKWTPDLFDGAVQVLPAEKPDCVFFHMGFSYTPMVFRRGGCYSAIVSAEDAKKQTYWIADYYGIPWVASSALFADGQAAMIYVNVPNCAVSYKGTDAYSDLMPTNDEDEKILVFLLMIRQGIYGGSTDVTYPEEEGVHVMEQNGRTYQQFLDLDAFRRYITADGWAQACRFKWGEDPWIIEKGQTAYRMWVMDVGWVCKVEECTVTKVSDTRRTYTVRCADYYNGGQRERRGFVGELTAVKEDGVWKLDRIVDNTPIG